MTMESTPPQDLPIFAYLNDEQRESFVQYKTFSFETENFRWIISFNRIVQYPVLKISKKTGKELMAMCAHPRYNGEVCSYTTPNSWDYRSNEAISMYLKILSDENVQFPTLAHPNTWHLSHD